MATDLLNRIATEDDEEYTLQPGSRYTSNNNNNKNKYNQIEDETNDDDQYGKQQSRKKPKRGQNGYHTVDIYQNAYDDDDDDDDQEISGPKNPFDALDDTFKKEEDPEIYVAVYNHIKQDIRMIEQNIIDVSKLRDNFNLSDSQKQYQSIMNQLDDIMMRNARLNRKIKKSLEDEKIKNDKLSGAEDHRSSSILQWRVNQLNACVRSFKSMATSFEQELSSTKRALKQKEKRKLQEFDERNELDEEKIDYMVDHPDQLESFLQKKFEGMAAADALLDRVAELEDRHQGMMKIEKSIKELHELWNELNVMVTEQQENLDRIEANVEETKHYMEKASKNLVSAEKKQKSSRKLACCAVCCLLIIAILVIVFVGGFIKFS